MDDDRIEALADRFLRTARDQRAIAPQGWDLPQVRLLVVGAMRFALTRGADAK